MMTPLYNSFSQAALQWFELAPIDYFLAKEVCQALSEVHVESNVQPLSREQQHQLFHLIVMLSQSLRTGHSCIVLTDIAGQRFGYACDSEGFVSHHGYTLATQAELIALLSQLNITPAAQQLLVFKDNKLYLRRYYQFEHELSQAIESKLSQQVIFDPQAVTDCLMQLFNQVDDNSDNGEIDWQMVGVANALNKNFSVIAGGPGTGKTYTVTKLLAGLIQLQQGLTDQPLNIMLSAPTGKAAQRLSESISQAVSQFQGQITPEILAHIPQQATTLHRLLGVIPNSPNFRHHHDNKLAIDVLLIDEVSMVDLAMMTRVLRALPDSCKVILLGDADQLPSVATGSVLTDIAPRPHKGYSKENCQYLMQVTGNKNLKTHQVRANKVADDHVTFLTKSRRFDGEGLIGRLATAVIAGEGLQSWQLLANPSEQDLSANNNFNLLLASDINSWLHKLVRKYYQPLFNFTEVSDAFKQLTVFSILCATRKGEAGVENINQQVKNILSTLGCLRQDETVFHGQPIMISENDYNVGLFNGDIGLIWRHPSGHLMAVFEADPKDQSKKHNEDDNQSQEKQYRWFIPSRLPPFETVFAMTIHKTQGSEFNHVAMVLPNQQDNKLLSRELLYTGITRAKSILSICASANVWQVGVENKVKRNSGLTINNAR